MPVWVEALFTHRRVAQIALFGLGFDLLGGCYLAYDLLGGAAGPLGAVTRAAGYLTIFFFGYGLVLGLRFATVAALGMGILLAIEYRRVKPGAATDGVERRRLLLFGFIRGWVLGAAAMTIAGAAYGAWFGLFSAIGLTAFYSVGLAPTDDYAAEEQPSITAHKVWATLSRAFAVSVAGVMAGLLHPVGSQSLFFGLRLGLAAGVVSGLVGLFSPVIEWRIDHLPERRLGIFGLILIFVGVVLQSVQYWVAI